MSHSVHSGTTVAPTLTEDSTVARRVLRCMRAALAPPATCLMLALVLAGPSYIRNACTGATSHVTLLYKSLLLPRARSASRSCSIAHEFGPVLSCRMRVVLHDQVIGLSDAVVSRSSVLQHSWESAQAIKLPFETVDERHAFDVWCAESIAASMRDNIAIIKVCNSTLKLA